MADQLSLRLDAALPRLPRAIRPMLATPAAEPFDSPDHFFEPVWGGVRAFAYIEADAGAGGVARGGSRRVRIVDADGEDLSDALPELAALAAFVSAEAALLDGEVVVVDGAGLADERALRARLEGRGERTAVFLAFDVLDLDGRPLLNQPLDRRRAALQRVARPGDVAVLVPAVREDGRALYDAAMETGLAGVRARAVRSPYLPGVRSTLWRFIGRGAHTGVGNDTPDTPDTPDRGAPDEGAPRGETAPVLALIRRLPMDESEG